MKRGTRCRQWGIVLLLLPVLSCAGLDRLLGNDGPPAGRYEPLAITGGSLLVSRGECSYPDMDRLQRGANLAIETMRAAWPLFPAGHVTVHALPVTFAIDPWGNGIQATGVYWSDEQWIELRCEYEFVIEHEMFHALGHQMRVPCWRTIGHEHNADCTLK